MDTAHGLARSLTERWKSSNFRDWTQNGNGITDPLIHLIARTPDLAQDSWQGKLTCSATYEELAQIYPTLPAAIAPFMIVFLFGAATELDPRQDFARDHSWLYWSSAHSTYVYRIMSWAHNMMKEYDAGARITSKGYPFRGFKTRRPLAESGFIALSQEFLIDNGAVRKSWGEGYMVMLRAIDRAYKQTITTSMSKEKRLDLAQELCEIWYKKGEVLFPSHANRPIPFCEDLLSVPAPAKRLVHHV